jgi:nucleotide-binding universal stress UspA family protein
MVVSAEGASVDTGATVVVGVDGTELSLEALERTVRFAKAVSARVVVCFVRHLDIPMSDPATGVAAVVVLEGAEDELAGVAQKAASKVLDGSGLAWEFVSRLGEPAHEIIDVAHETDASWIVVGASIHGPISGFFLSSVASHLLHHSDVSVAIVRPSRHAPASS